MSESCEYWYQGKVLTGNEIIKSFSDNHDKASQKISIEYIDGKVNKVEGQIVFVGVQDQLSVDGKSHLYQDCLAITCNDQTGPGSIEKIEHCPIQKEREKLSQFLQRAGVKL